MSSSSNTGSILNYINSITETVTRMYNESSIKQNPKTSSYLIFLLLQTIYFYKNDPKKITTNYPKIVNGFLILQLFVVCLVAISGYNISQVKTRGQDKKPLTQISFVFTIFTYLLVFWIPYSIFSNIVSFSIDNTNTSNNISFLIKTILNITVLYVIVKFGVLKKTLDAFNIKKWVISILNFLITSIENARYTLQTIPPKTGLVFLLITLFTISYVGVPIFVKSIQNIKGRQLLDKPVYLYNEQLLATHDAIMNHYLLEEVSVDKETGTTENDKGIVSKMFSSLKSPSFSDSEADKLDPDKVIQVRRVKPTSGLFSSFYRPYFANRNDNYNYTLSFWLYLNPQPPSMGHNFTKMTTVLDYGGMPLIEYNMKKHKLRISMETIEEKDKTNVQDMKTIYETEKLPLLRWNYFVINYSRGIIDIFINGNLVKSEQKILNYMKPRDLIVGADKGISGGISNVMFYTTNLTKRNIDYTYNLLKTLDPPVL